MDLTYRNYHYSSIHSNDPFISPSGTFPVNKTKLLKSARKHLEESHNSSFTNIANEKELNSGTFEAKYPSSNLPTIDPIEKSIDLTPLKDGRVMNFMESMKSPPENQGKSFENETNNDTSQRKNEGIEQIINDLRAQNSTYKKALDEFRNNEKKLKDHVQNLLDVNMKLTAKMKQTVNQENVNGNVLIRNNSLENKNNYIEELQKQLQDCNDEKDYLQDKIINLNQKCDSLLKKDVYKEKMIDFYKNRIKLYQFKLENYPKSEKEQIKCLEDYVMAILGENSKLNKALEKSEMESKKWQEKYFEFDKSREVLLTGDYTMKDKINNISQQKKFNPNNIHEKEINNSAKKEETTSFWSCRPKNK